jgi:hypothetical protein
MGASPWIGAYHSHISLQEFWPFEVHHNRQSISIKRLQTILSKAKDKKYRNELIVQCYDKGYSQHMMATVLGITVGSWWDNS